MLSSLLSVTSVGCKFSSLNIFSCCAGVLRGSVVFRRVLVLQRLHPLHARRLRGVSGAAADEEHVRDPANGEQALYDSGNSSASIQLYFLY